MFKRWNRMKLWVRWVVGSFMVIVLLCIAGSSFLYYKIHSIHLADIQERQKQRQQGKSTVEGSTSVPSVLSGSVGKANQFANKPIQAQDALDAASILLNSGLSLKEIYFLTGKSTDNLSTKEKLNIRNLLLSKLSKDEIAALRSITSQYGKGLLILDPNYPIELVGVYDELARAKIKKELQENKKTANPHTSEQASSPEPTNDAVPLTINKPQSTEAAKQINAKYTAQLNALQSACQAKVNTLISEIASSLKLLQNNKEPISADTLQNTYLAKIMVDDQRCDQQFNSLLDNAKQEYDQAGLTSDEADAWKAKYTNAKDQARMKAMSQLKLSAK